MLLRVISDLHLDINRKYPLYLKQNCDYTLVAGDLGGDRLLAEKWLRDNVTKGSFISGNHDCYTPDNTTLEDIKRFYHEKFPVDSDVSYLDSDVGVISKELEDGTLLVADVLYTDYTFRPGKLYSGYSLETVVAHNMFSAKPKMSGSYMNDFMFFKRDGKDGKEYLKPEDYLAHFTRTFAEIDRIVTENQDRNIILMTHHGLSEKCLSERYATRSLCASYVSDKSAWIRKHPNIRLVVSGHVHNRNTFHVGKTLYVMNPLGYCKEFQYKYTDGKTGKTDYWTPDLFVDTKTWKVTSEKYFNEEWNRQEEEDHRNFMRFAGFFV
jgi:predicted phosphodiesterase